MGRYTSNSMVVLLSHCLEGLTYTMTVLNGNIVGHVPWNSVMGVDNFCMQQSLDTQWSVNMASGSVYVHI